MAQHMKAESCISWDASRCNLQLPVAEMTFKSYIDDHRWKCRCSDDIIMVARSSIARARLRPYYIIQLYSWIISRMFLPAGSAAGSSAGRLLFYTHVPVLSFFASQERHVAPINVTFGREIRSFLPNFTLIGSGVGLRPPKLKKWNFTNIIAPKG